MLKRYLFQINKTGPISLDEFKQLKLLDRCNSNNYTKDEINYLLDYIKQNNPTISYICEVINFYINSNEEIEREIYYMCLKKKNKYKNFLSNDNNYTDTSYTENEEIFIIHPEDNEFEKYIEYRKKKHILSKQLNIKSCNNLGISNHFIKETLLDESNIIKKIENKNKKSKFKIFKPNLSMLNNLKKFSTNTKTTYQPPIDNIQKIQTLIIKSIPTDIFYKQIESILRNELRVFKNHISSIKVVKSHDNNNKGIAFVDITNENSLNKILETRIVIENMILSIEKKI